MHTHPRYPSPTALQVRFGLTAAEAEIAQAIAAYASGENHLAVMVIRLSWSDYDGQRIRLRQQKTGTSLSIPVHPDLQAVLEACPRPGMTILTTKTGLRFHPRVFSRDFRDARIQAGLPEGLSFHGLRHTAAARLAELGAGAPEIQAITGHKSLKLVEHYIRQASQELQADRAISRLPKRESAKPDC